jgi:RNA polymerase sigma factor (sigma-70 family)
VTLDHETESLIEQALARVNPTFRDALVLREIEGMSYEEIAGVLGISLGTVKSRILRGGNRCENNSPAGWSRQELNGKRPLKTAV